MPRTEYGLNPGTGLSGAESRKALARAAIDAETSAAILSGFSYEVDSEVLHFSYDRDDQQNFADTANACILYTQGTPGVPDSVTWNAYRGAEQELVRLTFTAESFLRLYTTALTHKATCMAEGGAKKAALEGEEV